MVTMQLLTYPSENFPIVEILPLFMSLALLRLLFL